jgi:hypothetical protein
VTPKLALAPIQTLWISGGWFTLTKTAGDWG